MQSRYNSSTNLTTILIDQISTTMSRQTTLMPRKITFEEHDEVHPICVDETNNYSADSRTDNIDAVSLASENGHLDVIRFLADLDANIGEDTKKITSVVEPNKAPASRSLKRVPKLCRCNECDSQHHDHQVYRISSSQDIITCENASTRYCTVPRCLRKICAVCWIDHQKRHETSTN